MRRLALVAALIMAGCADPPQAAGDDPATTVPLADDPVVLLDATLDWHQEDGSPTWPYDLAAQAFVNPCLWDDPDEGREVYFTNLNLSVGGLADAPNGTVGLRVTLDWSDTDYAGENLVLAYRVAGRETWQETDYIPKGTTDLDVVDSDVAGPWGMWLCVSREGDDSLTDPSNGPRAFAGTVMVRIEALTA